MPEPTLQSTALRYAARDLTPAESAAFESLLSRDQDARDALAEAVRLSAAALGQTPPAPDRSFRQAIYERLAGWRILRRRAYRGHPVAWVALGAMAVAACTLIGLNLAESDAGPPALTDTTSPASEPALESRTARTRGKAFLFLRATEARLKLQASLKDAAARAAKEPGRYVVGSGGWVLVKLDEIGDADQP